MFVSPKAPKALVEPKFIEDFKSITNIDELKKTYTETHVWEDEWSKTFIVGSAVLGLLAAFAYKQAHQYAAELGILTLCSALNSRVKVLKPTPEYVKLCDTFNNVILGLRETWKVAADLISKEIIKKEYTSIEKADQEASCLLYLYKNTPPDTILTIDPFKAIEKKPMRDQFQKLYPIAEEFVETASIKKIWEDPELHPDIIPELDRLYKESERLVRGSSFKSSDRAYVENTLSGEYVTPARWPAPPLIKGQSG